MAVEPAKVVAAVPAAIIAATVVAAAPKPAVAVPPAAVVAERPAVVVTPAPGACGISCLLRNASNLPLSSARSIASADEPIRRVPERVNGSARLMAVWPHRFPTLTDAQFLSFGWRIPFLASSVLVFFGLYVRLKITETPVFSALSGRVAVPIFAVCRRHAGALVLGTFIALATFVLFYLLTVFALSWGTTHLGYSRGSFLVIQMIGVVFFALMIPLSAELADRYGRRRVLLLVSAGIVGFGLAFGPLFSAGLGGVVLTMIVGLALMGLTYGPLGTLLSELFPTAVRYTGSSITFNLAGIFGASLAPYFATWLATNFGLRAVGWYLSGAALLTLLALAASRETRDTDYSDREIT